MLKKGILAIAFLLGASLAALPEAAIFAHLDRRQDSRQWNIGHQFTMDAQMLVEYVLDQPGESVEHWSELVTVEVCPELGVSPLEFAERYAKTQIATSFVCHPKPQRRWICTLLLTNSA